MPFSRVVSIGADILIDGASSNSGDALPDVGENTGRFTRFLVRKTLIRSAGVLSTKMT